jgi:acyl carrier protein
MDKFYADLADLLEVDDVDPAKALDSYDNWDSLTILSLITMLDADFGVTLHASDIRQYKTAADLLAGVQAKAAN